MFKKLYFHCGAVTVLPKHQTYKALIGGCKPQMDDVTNGRNIANLNICFIWEIKESFNDTFLHPNTIRP